MTCVHARTSMSRFSANFLCRLSRKTPNSRTTAASPSGHRSSSDRVLEVLERPRFSHDVAVAPPTMSSILLPVGVQIHTSCLLQNFVMSACIWSMRGSLSSSPGRYTHCHVKHLHLCSPTCKHPKKSAYEQSASPWATTLFAVLDSNNVSLCRCRDLNVRVSQSIRHVVNISLAPREQRDWPMMQ